MNVREVSLFVARGSWITEGAVPEVAFEALAKDLGVKVGEFDSMETGPEMAQQPASYFLVMRRNAKALVNAFGGRTLGAG